ncbi:helix-turn-helix transcriptional regulator [Microbacterium sp. JZ37]|uniref:helix-turn-helix transcriptional regulator n=1 Tax=Microbacterium sp. JZ37 TaxID=2654193 RepID=UPI002B48084F|nr:helix-turn-helix domain-containing protein [Microbacterium sp. JZ37]WRH17650.1 helix-turn-helix domain-containing protein [Microbacterium sp. JZ37]
MTDADSEATRRIRGLADPLRRAIYAFLSRQRHAVTRDEAASALDIPHHQAKFHLDRLEQDGLVTVDYARPPGRTGPGAGRPAKRYRPAESEIAVSVPPRGYDVAGDLLARAITRSAADGIPVAEAVADVARARGRAIAAARGAEPPVSASAAREAAEDILRGEGYEPEREGPTTVLRNCPFHRLAQDHRDLVCGMNCALIDGVGDALAPHSPVVALEPEDGRCCVTLREGA